MGIAGAVRRALIVAAFAFVLVPGGVAHAQAFGVAGYERVVQQQGILAGQFASIEAVCPAGKQVIGGGFDVGNSGTLEVSISAPVSSGNLSADRWQTFVHNAGMLTQTARTFAQCATSGLPGYELRTNPVSVAAGVATDVGVLCSTGKKVLAGGFQLETASAFKLFSSLPANQQSSFIDNGWNLFVQNTDTNTDTVARQAVVYAVCVDGNVSGYERQVNQPNVDPGTLEFSATCTAGTRVTGGGFRVETPDDVKLLATRPGDGLGVPIDNGWANRVRNIGGSTRGVTVAAICVDTADVTPPDTTITSPPGPANDNTPTFMFTSTAIGSTFQCRIDAAAFTSCSSPFTTAALTDGAHTFEVRAIDAAGNVDPTPASRSFTIVTTTTIGVLPIDPAPLPDRDTDAVADARDNCVDVANTSQADKDGDGIGDACDRSDASVGPTLAKNVVGRVVSGAVFVRFPPGTQPRSRSRARAAQVPAGFVPLKGAEVLPIGTVVDARRGRLALTSAASRIGGRTQTQRAEFFDGRFQIKQRRAKRPTTDLVLRSTNFVKECGSGARSVHAARAGTVVAAQARRSKRVVSRLWGNGRGRFRTRGRHSAATVRGTIWMTAERCDGTLTRVTRGSVSVRDQRANRTVIVRAGQSYLARAVRASVQARRP